jgi:hypothetical protein
VIVAVASVGWLASTRGGASTEAAPPPQSEHERIVRYWTPERVAHARPRDIVVDAPARPLGKPGGGGPSGGGGTSSTVTGATWTQAGDVKERTGKVLFTMDGSNWVCSGTVVADNRGAESIVLTAGHCVYDDAKNEFATNWMFVPDFQQGGTFSCPATQYGCWTAAALVTTTAWGNRDFDEDYGFAVMGVGGRTGATSLDGAVGAYPIAFNLPRPAGVYALGYPAAGKYSGGKTLTYCAGTEINDPYNSTTFGLRCDMTGGSSGGPWLADFGAFDSTNAAPDALTSVNSYGYSGGPYKGYMFGPRFDAYTQATLAAANDIARGSNLLVPPPPGS